MSEREGRGIMELELATLASKRAIKAAKSRDKRGRWATLRHIKKEGVNLRLYAIARQCEIERRIQRLKGEL